MEFSHLRYQERPVPPELQGLVDYLRQITTGAVPSDPRVLAIAAYYSGRIAYRAREEDSFRDALQFFLVALQNGYAKAAEELGSWEWSPGKEQGIAVLIDNRAIPAAAAELYKLAEKRDPVALRELQQLADARPPDQVANRILGMAAEFGGVGHVDGADVQYASDFTEAARRYALGGCEADLLGMAQAGHAEALHILEQRPLAQKAGAIGYRLKLAFDADDNSGSTAIRERAIQAVKSAVDAPKEG